MKSEQKQNHVSLSEIGELFDQALSLPKSDRISYVKKACEGKPALEEEVLSLLHSNEDAPDFLSKGPAVVEALQHKKTQLDAPPEEFRPKAFGSYVLLRRMGMGGMAEIFHAVLKGEGGFTKQVAVKSILPTLTDDATLRELFEKEAHVSSVLTHVNIAQVFDFFQAGDNFFLTMEFIAGKNLVQIVNRLNGTQFSQPLACHIMSEVAKGLSYAHSVTSSPHGITSGIIHRDISPKNIMCSYEGEVKIVDFGIAKVRERVSSENRSLHVYGTHRYMSPEQAFGEELDHRSDIFSVGLVLYELLMGKTLFLATDHIEALKEMRAYSGAGSHLEGRALPDPLREILIQALAAHPDDRYASAGDFHLELQQYLRNLPFNSGYSRLANFIQSLFSGEIEREQSETAKAISRIAHRAKEETRELSGTSAESNHVIFSKNIETTSLIISKRKKGKSNTSSFLRLVVPVVLIGAILLGTLLLNPQFLETLLAWLE